MVKRDDTKMVEPVRLDPIKLEWLIAFANREDTVVVEFTIVDPSMVEKSADAVSSDET